MPNPTVGSELPNGVIDSPELFFAAIRERAAMDPALIDGAITVLEDQYQETLRKIDGDFQLNDRRYRMVFFTAMFIGAKLSWKRYLMYLKSRAFDANRELALTEDDGGPKGN